MDETLVKPPSARSRLKVNLKLGMEDPSFAEAA